MDYNKMNRCEAECCVPVQAGQAANETLTEMQKKSTAMSNDILSMVNRLSVYFFGPENMKPEEKQPIPDCFLNDLSLHIQMQSETLNMLNKLIDRLGA